LKPGQGLRRSSVTSTAAELKHQKIGVHGISFFNSQYSVLFSSRRRGQLFGAGTLGASIESIGATWHDCCPGEAQPFRGDLMANVFVEPAKGGGYQIEFADGSPAKTGFKTQDDAIQQAKKDGHHPLVARVRELNDKDKPDHWRSA